MDVVSTKFHAEQERRNVCLLVKVGPSLLTGSISLYYNVTVLKKKGTEELVEHL